MMAGLDLEDNIWKHKKNIYKTQDDMFVNLPAVYGNDIFGHVVASFNIHSTNSQPLTEIL